jgi:cytochrome c-type biogenesis protein CcmH/NrfG
LIFAVDRLDTWVLRASIAIPLMCLVVLGVWNLAAWLARKLPQKPRKVRESPEPPSPANPWERPAWSQAWKESALGRESPERLEQACLALENSLANAWLELAESLVRAGQLEKAVVVWNKVVQICPDRPQAQLARDRIEQIGKGSHS